jgi:hypothetical protein
VGLEDRASGADSAVRAALVVLGSWSSLVGRMMGEGEAVDEGTRGQLRDEIKACEDNLHRCVGSVWPLLFCCVKLHYLCGVVIADGLH